MAACEGRAHDTTTPVEVKKKPGSGAVKPERPMGAAVKREGLHAPPSEHKALNHSFSITTGT